MQINNIACQELTRGKKKSLTDVSFPIFGHKTLNRTTMVSAAHQKSQCMAYQQNIIMDQGTSKRNLNQTNPKVKPVT